MCARSWRCSPGAAASAGWSAIPRAISVLSEALYAICETAPARFAALTEESDIITVSARVQMPRAAWRIVDVIGALDAFGALNSTPGIGADIEVPLASHHTNTELPFHLRWHRRCGTF